MDRILKENINVKLEIYIDSTVAKATNVENHITDVKEST